MEYIHPWTEKFHLSLAEISNGTIVRGALPPEYDQDFMSAVAGFSVAVQGLSLEPTQKIMKYGLTYGWVKVEDEGDWFDKVTFP